MARINNMIIAIAATLAVIVACIGAAVFVFCADDDNVDGISVVDMRGRKVTVPHNVQKVACVGAGALRLVSYFGIDKVVGVDSGDALKFGSPNNYNLASYHVAYDIKAKVDDESLKNVDSLSNHTEILRSGAQVIFTTESSTDKIDNVQHNTKIPVIGLRQGYSSDFDTEDFLEQITLIGTVLGEKDRSKDLIDYIHALKGELKNLKKQVGTDVNHTKLYVGGIMINMAGSLYQTTGNYPPFTWSVGENVMSNLDKHQSISKEGFIKSMPDIIFVDISNYDACIDELKDKKLLSNIPAVQNEKIYTLLPYKYYNTNFDCELINCFAVGSIIAPSVYPDISEKATEIFQKFFPGTDMTYEKYTNAIGHKIGHISITE